MGNFKRALILLIVVGFIGLGANNLIQSKRTEENLRNQLQQVEGNHTQTQQQLDQIKGDNAKTKKQKLELEKKTKQQEKQIKDLQQKLSVKRANARRLANAVTRTETAHAAPAPTAPNTSGGCGDNTYKQFIYTKESTCNITAVNPGGCIGIGQSCPGGSGLAADCPDWRTNFACQDAHFTKYANSRYGGWAQAYAAWQRQGWW